MPKRKVLVAIPQRYWNYLDWANLAEVADFELVQPDKGEVLKRIGGVEVLVCLMLQVDAEIINAGKQLRVIQTLVVGYENIDVKTATEKGIIVCNASESPAESVAEFTWALMLSLARRVPMQDKLMREGRERYFMGEKQVGLWGKTLGLVGFGAIGKRVAMKGRLTCNMKILVYDPFVLPEQVDMFGGKLVELETLLRESDVVSIHSPITIKTRHMIGEKELGLMKKSALLVNTARGAIIDEAALIKHLQKERILGAALDVYEVEPLPKDSPLRQLENVILAPHVSTTPEAEHTMFMTSLENAVSYLRDGRIFRVVNTRALKS